MGEILKEAFDLGQELTDDMTHMRKLDKFWAQKKNRTYLALSDEVTDELARMFMTGQGTKNKALRYSAEKEPSASYTAVCCSIAGTRNVAAASEKSNLSSDANSEWRQKRMM